MEPTKSTESYLEAKCPKCSSRTVVRRPEPKTERVRCVCNKCQNQWWESDSTFTGTTRGFEPGRKGLD